MSAMPEFIPAQSMDLPVSRRRCQSGVRPERYLATIAWTGVGTAVLALWIGGHVQVTVAGYQVRTLQAELSRLQLANRSLRGQAALLSDPMRITSDAPRLAMQRVSPAETLYVQPRESTPKVGSSSPGANQPKTTSHEAIPAQQSPPGPTTIAMLNSESFGRGH